MSQRPSPPCPHKLRSGLYPQEMRVLELGMGLGKVEGYMAPTTQLTPKTGAFLSCPSPASTHAHFPTWLTNSCSPPL